MVQIWTGPLGLGFVYFTTLLLSPYLSWDLEINLVELFTVKAAQNVQFSCDHCVTFC